MIAPDSFYTGMVCLNGHEVTDRLEDLTARAAPYCSQCGEPTISSCPKCDAPVRGDYQPPRGYAHVLRKYRAPLYCDNCGAPYPWTERRLDAARQLIDESALEDGEKETLKGTFEALTRDSAETPLATVKYKRLASKLGSEGLTALKSILVSVATEAVRRELFS